MSYASWFARVGGYLIDNILASIPGGIGAVVAVATAKDGKMSGTGVAAYAIGGLISLALLIYNRWVKGGSTGQTWGRSALGIKLVGDTTGQPIGAGMAFVRDLAHIVDTLICYIGWLFPLWDKKGQTVADKIMKTVVVKA
ncbi:MAG TPA: RDD family protein [Micromonosporaceae bacterium]|jgi:uncharacterized RDD family membrane protein YckC|nr:RDD family protein [Micromonosporaceae bacterium]